MLESGVQPDMTTDLKRRMALANYMGSVGPVINGTLFVFSTLLGATEVAWILLISGVVYAVAFALIRYGQHRIGRHLFALSANGAALGIWLVDPFDPMAYSLFVTVFVSALFFTARETLDALAHAAIGMAYMAIMLLSDHADVQAILDAPPLPALVSIPTVLVCLIVPPAMIMALSHLVARYEVAQENVRDALHAEVEHSTAIARELAEQTCKAQAASQAKSAFLANMSHEIRTPLGAIMSLTDLGLATDDKEAREEYLKLTRRAAGHLLQVLNDVLDVSKIEAGKLELDHGEHDLALVVSDVMELVKGKAETKGLSVTLDSDLGAVCWRRLDATRLRQILLNLLNNAIKFTADGGVTLRVRSDGERVTFEVIDTGIGMTEEQAVRVFQPFEQATTKTAAARGGTGLGLAITSNLLALWDSARQVDSTPGLGTTFRFALALPDASREASLTGFSSDPDDGRSLRVLVAEDNPVNQLIIRRILEDLGHMVHVVGDGEQAVRHLREEDHGVDIVLMDMRMPVMDGVEATRTIRVHESEAGRTSVPIVALTANALADQRDLCLNAGMDDWLTKPVDKARLQRVLSLMTGPEGRGRLVG